MLGSYDGQNKSNFIDKLDSNGNTMTVDSANIPMHSEDRNRKLNIKTASDMNATEMDMTTQCPGS